MLKQYNSNYKKKVLGTWRKGDTLTFLPENSKTLVELVFLILPKLSNLTEKWVMYEIDKCPLASVSQICRIFCCFEGSWFHGCTSDYCILNFKILFLFLVWYLWCILSVQVSFSITLLLYDGPSLFRLGWLTTELLESSISLSQFPVSSHTQPCSTFSSVRRLNSGPHACTVNSLHSLAHPPSLDDFIILSKDLSVYQFVILLM